MFFGIILDTISGKNKKGEINKYTNLIFAQ